MPNSQSNKSAFDADALISHVLSYAQHGRLMVIMGAFGLLAGIVYCVYSKAVYQSRSVVYVRAFGAPLRDIELPETRKDQYTVYRSLYREFTSRRNVLGAARRMGLVGPDATWEDAIAIVPV